MGDHSTVTADYIIRSYEAGDEKEINKLFNDSFGENRLEKEWYWKFFENPYTNMNINTVAEANGKIVGQYANIPLIFKLQQNIIKVVMPVDNVVHPDYRGGFKGIQWGMFELARKMVEKENIALGIGFPNRDAYIIGKRVLKYKDIGKIPVLFRRLNFRAAVRRRFPWLPVFFITVIQLLCSTGFRLMLNKRTIGIRSNVKINAADGFDERFNLLWDKVKGRYGMICVRGQKYLNWRYQKPGKDYKIFIANNTEIEGYIVISIKGGGEFVEGYIVDMMAVNDEVYSLLIKRALIEFISMHVDYALCWMIPNSTEYNILRENGFIETEAFQPINAVYLNFDPDNLDESFIKEINNWYITMGDSDVY